MLSTHDIEEIISDISDRITHLQQVREDATKEISQLIDSKHKLIDAYMNDAEEV